MKDWLHVFANRFVQLLQGDLKSNYSSLNKANRIIIDKLVLF